MKLNENTLTVLRNFATIQPNLVVEAGVTLKTMAEARNVMCTANLDQTFDKGFGIYDLNEFLNVLTLVDDPTLDFNENYVSVSDASGRSKVKYFFVGDNSILTSPQSAIKMPECEVQFTLDGPTLSKIRKASSVLGHQKLIIKSSGSSLELSVTDNADATSNSYVIEVPGTFPSGATFSFVMTIDNMKLISGDYDVEISKKFLSKFTNKQTSVEYFIALEKSSSYSE